MSTQSESGLSEALAASLLPQRDPRGHKGTFGRVVVVAGSLDYAGAALMAGLAALRAGAGLVSLYVPASLQPLIAGRVPELITRAMPESAPVTKMAPVSGCFLCAGDSHAGCAWATTASASQSQVGAPAPVTSVSA